MFVYLASPYSDPDWVVREERFKAACEKAARLMMQGYTVFAPIAHSHPVAGHLETKYLIHHEFWMKQDLPILERADKLVILTLPGFEKSKGVKAEFVHARERGINIEAHDMDGLTFVDWLRCWSP